MSLSADIDVRRRNVSASITVGANEALVLVGPNGSGKSTIVEAIAGLVPLDAGAITVAGSQYSPRARGRAREGSSHVALVPQDGVLLPHLSVLDNVAFGLRARGTRRGDARASASVVLERVDGAHLTNRRPHELSGGEVRRIAIARALALEPQVMLLDEPFAGLDVHVAAGVRALVASVRSHTTIVLTTHNAADAVLLGDQVAVLNEGRIVEQGMPHTVFTQPRTAFTARMAGRVLVTGTISAGCLVTDAGASVPVTGEVSVGGKAAIAVRPVDVRAQTIAAPRDEAHTWLVHDVTGFEALAETIRIHGGTLAADVDPEHARTFSAGSPIAFGIPNGLPAYAL